MYDASKPKWRNSDHCATKVIKAIKGLPFNGSAEMKIFGQPYVLTATNAHEMIPVWAKWAVSKISDLPKPIRLVPVPNSGAIVSEPAESFRTLEMAYAVAAAATAAGIQASAHARLRWAEQMVKASKGGGPRNPHTLLDKLRFCDPPLPEGTVVLIDDVITLGGHMMACVEALAGEGRRPARGVVAGRTVHDALDHPFAVPVLNLGSMGSWYGF
ncbi:hypothetical protein H7965_26470 [Siccirubricoccus deserti]|uniref:Phosphoribosyltransferase n=1 Tax=Siccirubricoccus deserti TaxID=2013562 RepID=A0A9X0UK56_9PROT|nr:hypothetical protein [Siccirubricoccus deserti]